MIDMRISQEIDNGENDAERICNKLRLKKEQLINAVTKSSLLWGLSTNGTENNVKRVKRLY